MPKPSEDKGVAFFLLGFRCAAQLQIAAAILQLDQTGKRAHLALLVLAQPKQKRHRGRFQLLDFLGFGIDDRRVCAVRMWGLDEKLAHSITSSARVRSVGDNSRPIAFAARRLIINSYLEGACTGRSAGFSPLSTRST